MNDNKNFSCKSDQCENSCCGPYTGFSDDLLSLEKRPFKDIVLTPSDVSRLCDAGYQKFFYFADDGLGRIYVDEDGVCSAFQNGLCEIHSVKPTVCKCYPLCIDVLTGLCCFKSCSAIDDSFNVMCFQEQLGPLIAMYEFWISYYRKFVLGSE